MASALVLLPPRDSPANEASAPYCDASDPRPPPLPAGESVGVISISARYCAGIDKPIRIPATVKTIVIPNSAHRAVHASANNWRNPISPLAGLLVKRLSI